MKSGRRGKLLRMGAPAAVGLALLACYWFTLAPTMCERDSGEIATAVHVMGVMHPTGYPLYLMVGKLFDLLPLGEPAHRIALFSAVSVAAAGGLVCWMLMALGAGAAAGLLGGLVMGLNWWVWPQANQVEVYALNLALTSLVLVMFVRWHQEPGARRLNQLALCCGLSLTHHRLALFFAAPALLWAVGMTRPISSRRLLRTAGYAALPLLLYLWLPFRSAFKPPVNWGDTSASLDYFLAHIKGSLYYGYAFGSNMTAVAGHFTLALGKLWQQFGPVGLALALFGLVGMVSARRWRSLGLLLIAAFGVVVIFGLWYNVDDRQVFLTPDLIVLGLWCGFGLGEALRWARAMRRWRRLARLAPALAAAVAVALPLRMGIVNWKQMDRSREYDALESAALNLAGIPPSAVVLVIVDDPMNYALYYWHCLDHGPAPVVLHTYLALQPWSEPLLEPGLRETAIEVRSMEVPPELTKARPLIQSVEFTRRARQRLAPDRPLYTNVPLRQAPPGYVMVRDYTLNRIEAPPGIAQAPDRPGAHSLLDFPDGAGSLVDLALPAQVARGQVFALTAAIRWAQAAQPADDLHLVFARQGSSPRIPQGHHRVGIGSYAMVRRGLLLFGLDVSQYDPEAVSTRHRMVRPTPLLFWLTLPASRPGWHYQQTVNALFPRSLLPGRYNVFAKLVSTDGELLTPLARVGAITVR